MVNQLKEYEVMEVFSDHVEAFNLEFGCISDFIHNEIILSLPQKVTFIFFTKETLEDDIKEKLKNDKVYYKEYYGVNEKYYRKIEKVMKLLKEKILFE